MADTLGWLARAVHGGASSTVPFDRCFCLTGHRSAPALMARVVGDDLRHDAGYQSRVRPGVFIAGALAGLHMGHT